jgi:periplasmic protein TonB
LKLKSQHHQNSAYRRNAKRSAAVGLSLPLCLSLALLVTACGKSERELTTEERLKAVATKQESQPDFFVPRKSVDYTADLKNLREAPRADPNRAEPTPAPKAEPVRAAPVAAAPAPTPAPIAAAPAPTPVVPAPVAQAPIAQAPAPAPAPAARPSGDTNVVVVNREQPNFPREAVRQGVENGTVRARISINANGDPTGVTIVSSRPGRVFDREVQQTLSRWKFNPGADGRSFETEINFQR